MTKRQRLWAVLGEASDAVLAAFAEWQHDNTPATRASVETAAREYVDRLAPVVGHEAAFRYQASLQAVVTAIERNEGLTATMTARSAIDDADAAMMRQCATDQADAVREFERVASALQVALDEAEARDAGDAR